MRRFIKFLSAVLPFLAAEAIQYIVVNCLILINAFELTEQVIYLYSVIGIAISGIVFFFWYRTEKIGEARGSIKEIFTVKNIGLFAFLGIGCQMFFSALMTVITPYFLEIFTDYAKVINSITSGSDMVVLLLVLFIAPVTEELIFRGVILHMANRYVTFLGANILQALLFGIYHGNIVQGIYAALLGFLLGSIYYKYQSILAPIVLHIIINASAFLTYLFPDNSAFYVVVMAAGGILLILALMLLQPTKSILYDTRMQRSDSD